MGYNLQSESEVKQYVQNLGTEYRFGCYSEKKPEVCHLLADFLEAIKKDYEKAGKVYKNNCDEYKYAKSCLKYGGYSLIGKGGLKANYHTAYDYYEKGCNLDEPSACFNQGLLLITQNEQHGLKQDIVKGLHLLEKACSGLNGVACYYLSGLYITGAKNGHKVGDKSVKEFDVPRNMKKAFQYALEGCNLGNMYSCANVSQMYAKGDGTEKNETLAKEYKAKALELQNEHDTTKESQTLKFGVGLD
ncbi:cytochrome c oxidase assembly factor 7 homolog [Sitophilus oryzae]|uniref:Cytochrome c oxidase assembly factor 7 homolog n=1 Tax=Sitophilus oryzae TaxID=7048 RepID=A0A6J2X8U7_SITOR|nr:cytochrome c oxidase assembly factor 7 homolog [Sitophilus oryzae]